MTISRRQFVAGICTALALPIPAIIAKEETVPLGFEHLHPSVGFDELDKFSKPNYGAIMRSYGPESIDGSEHYRSHLIWAVRPKEDGRIEFEFSTKLEHEKTIKRMAKDFLDKHADEYYNYIVVRRVNDSQDHHLVALGRMREVVTVEHILLMGSVEPAAAVSIWTRREYEDLAKLVLYNNVSQLLTGVEQ
jgi:hypothetical protein